MKAILLSLLLGIAVSSRLFAQNCTLTAAVTVNSSTICAGSTVTITAQASGGTAPYTYSWNTGETTPSITVSTAGTYTVTVSDNTGTCTVTASTTVSKPQFLKVSDAFICQGTQATLSASGADSYQWYDADGNLLSSQANYTTQILNSTATYYIAGTKNGCRTENTPVKVNVVPVPGAPNAQSVSICSGSTVTLSATSSEGTIFDWYNVPSGGTSLITSPDLTTPALTTTTTYYVQTYNSGCPGPRTAVTVTVNPLPQDPQTAGQTICYNSAATLTASATGGTIKWYDSTFGNTPLATGPTFQTGVLTSSTTFYVETANDQTGCTSKRVPVIVTVMQQVPHPTAPGTIICSGNTATLNASSTQSGTTFQWYDAATGGTLLSSNAGFTTPVLSTSATYYVQGTYQGCTGPRTAVTVNVTTIPAAPVVTGTTTVCPGNSTALTTDGNATSYQWYDAATGGNLVSTAITFVTPALTTNTSYYVQAANGQCTSNRTRVDITINPAPVAPTISAPTTICPGGTNTLTATGTGTITWFDAATGGNVVATGNTFTTPALSATTNYYAESSNGQCSSTRTAVTVTVTPVPNPVFTYDSGTFCLANGGTARPTIDPSVNGTYHFTASPAGLLINPNTGIITVTGSLPGSYSVTLTTTSNTCINATAAVSISAGVGSAQFSYSPNTFCRYDADPTPTLGSGAYAGRFTATPAGLVFADNTTGQIDLSQSAAGTYTITNRLLCAGTSASTTVTIFPRTAVNAGPDQNVASGAPVQLAGSKTGAAAVTWSGGNGSFSGANTLTPVYTPGPGETTATLTLSAANEGNGCAPLSDQMIVNFSPLAAPTAGGVTICEGTTATLTANAPGGDYQWYNAAVGGTLLFSGNPFTPSPTVTTIYYVQTTLNGVTSARTAVTATVTPAPVVTVTGNTICFDSQATLTASTTDATGGTFQWFDGSGTLLATGATYNTTYLQQNTRYFVRYITSPCSTTLIPVDVTVNPLPIITSALTAQTCSASAFAYTIKTSPAATSFNWSRSQVAGIDNAAATGQTADINETLVNSTTSPINVVYNITASSNSCSSTPFKLVVTVNPALVFTSAGTEEICNATSSDYQIKLNFTPSSISWSRAAVAGIRNPAISGQTSPTIHEVLYNDTNSPLTVTYVYTARSGGCATSTFNLSVTVDPTITVTSAATATVCSGTAFTYNITSKVTGATFNWARANISGISNAAATGAKTTTIAEALVNTTSKAIVVLYQITPFLNNCAGGVFNYRVTVNPTPETPVITTDSRVCTGTTLNLTTSTVAGATYTWSGPANFTSSLQNPSIANITQANAGDYALMVTVNGCPSAVSTKTITVDVQPVAAAGADQTVCASFPIQLKGTVTGGLTTGVWTSTGTGTFTPTNTDLNAKYMPSVADAALPSLTFTLSSSALDNCSISVSKLTVTLTPPPTVNAGGNKNVCDQNTSITLNGTAGNADTFVWTTTGTGTFSPSAKQLNTTYIMSAADLKNGAVNFLLSATNAYCMTYDEKTVKFLPPPVISAGNKKVNYVLRNSLFKLSPTVNGSNVKYLWSPNTYLDNDTLKNATFKAVADQTLTLVVTDTLGCVSSDQISFIVLDPIVTYNTFTPNGDGQNDTWVIPSINKYPGAKVDIYNRYGVQMFHSDGYGIPWDGTYQSQPVPVGVYYYVITTKFDTQIFSGYITVLR